MNQIKIELTLDNVNSKQAIALSNLFESLVVVQGVEVGNYDVEVVENEPVRVDTLAVKGEAPKKPRAPRGSKVQAGAFEGQERTESVVDEYEAAADLKVVEPSDANDDLLGEDKGYTQNEVREAMAKKIDSHRAAMKDKITELGASKFVDMPASKYPEFMDFLKSLS